MALNEILGYLFLADFATVSHRFEDFAPRAHYLDRTAVEVGLAVGLVVLGGLFRNGVINHEQVDRSPAVRIEPLDAVTRSVVPD